MILEVRGEAFYRTIGRRVVLRYTVSQKRIRCLNNHGEAKVRRAAEYSIESKSLFCVSLRAARSVVGAPRGFFFG